MSDAAFAKSVFISYSPEDAEWGDRLKEVLEQMIGPSVWARSIELKAGTLIAESVNAAVSNAKWFILFLSAKAIENPWIKMEANLATLRSIEDEDFSVILVRVDATEAPPHIQRVIKSYRVIDLAGSTDRARIDEEFLHLAIDIQQTQFTRSKARVYVDRGSDADQFTLAARRNRILFIVGWAGIGKSAFVKHSVSEKLGKHPLTITLTRSFSLDALCRQILYEARFPQPIGQILTDTEWVAEAMRALDQRSNNFFLFVDNAEEAIDPAAQLFGFLGDILFAFARSTIATHIILATTRMPEYPPSIAGEADYLHLDGLDDEYVKESIDLRLQGTPRHESVMAAPEMSELIASVGGHPLAAKMVAAYLKTRTPKQLLETNQARRIQLRLAEYMLRSANHGLTDLHKLILHILAGIGEPVLLQDMIAVKELADFPVEDVHNARWDLADWYLVEQQGDLIFLPKFFAAYFREQLHLQKGRFERLALEFGRYALDKALELNNTLSEMSTHPGKNMDQVVSLSSEVLRYAVPSGRLLRSIGQVELANRLPIEIKGTLRELVFHFYQIDQNYKQALEYADRWLAISPNDLDVMLYRVRCYRNIGSKEALKSAETLIRQLEKREAKRGFAARILREKAIIAERQGNIDLAKAYFKQGIEIDKMRTYPDNHIGLAQILLREIDESPAYVGQSEGAHQALRLLQEARDISATFDRFHLGLYVDALIHAGDDDAAFPLIEVALQDRPEDSRLNYRMAEILRKRDRLKDAERYALKALKFGARKATLTLANVYYAMGVALHSAGAREPGNVRLREALSAVDSFNPEYGNDAEVADGLAGKILCASGDYAAAASRIMKYVDTVNPYTIYEQCRVELRQAEQELARQNRSLALARLRSATRRIEQFAARQSLSAPLSEMLTDLRLRERDLNSENEG